MIYALRKLIAFVFLGGMFWFIYQDLDNLDKPWFMHALGLIAVAFAFFWLVIPMVVVWTRRRSRVRRNRERHAKWLAEGGTSGLSPHPAGRGKTASLASIGKTDLIFFHEKGTLYTSLSEPPYDGYAGPSRLGRPSDVALPRSLTLRSRFRSSGLSPSSQVELSSRQTAAHLPRASRSRSRIPLSPRMSSHLRKKAKNEIWQRS